MAKFRPDTFKVVQVNAENLFIYLDDTSDRDWRKMSEREWQDLSHATVANKPLSKTLWLGDSLLHIDADIIMVNEVGGVESLTNFSRHFLNDLYTPHLIEGNSDRGIDVGFLIKKDLELKPELRTHKDRTLGFLYSHEQAGPTLKSHRFSRDCAELRLFNNSSNRPAVIMLLVHLKSKLDPKGIDPFGRERRRAELKTLIEIYHEVRAEFTPAVPVIIAGDFNGCAQRALLADEFASLAHTDLQSVCDLKGLTPELAATQVQIGRGNKVTTLQIDYIFVSPELQSELILEGVEVYRYLSDMRVPMPLPQTMEQRSYLPSDHYPVIATFKNFLQR